MMDPAKFYHQFEQTVIGVFMPYKCSNQTIMFAFASFFLFN